MVRFLVYRAYDHVLRYKFITQRKKIVSNSVASMYEEGLVCFFYYLKSQRLNIRNIDSCDIQAYGEYLARRYGCARYESRLLAVESFVNFLNLFHNYDISLSQN